VAAGWSDQAWMDGFAYNNPYIIIIINLKKNIFTIIVIIDIHNNSYLGRDACNGQNKCKYKRKNKWTRMKMTTTTLAS